MLAAARSSLDARIAEVLMNVLCPCDLGDAIEVVHDVEAVEIEMECSVDDDAPLDPETAADTIKFSTEELINTTELARDELVNTTELARELSADDVGTHQFVRHSAPYERIELRLDDTFLRATIEEAKRITRSGGVQSQRAAITEQAGSDRGEREPPSPRTYGPRARD